MATGQAVNDFIPIDNYRLQYMTIDDIIHQIKEHGQGALLAKLDLEDAFKHINGIIWLLDSIMARPFVRMFRFCN